MCPQEVVTILPHPTALTAVAFARFVGTPCCHIGTALGLLIGQSSLLFEALTVDTSDDGLVAHLKKGFIVTENRTNNQCAIVTDHMFKKGNNILYVFFKPVVVYVGCPQ